MFKQFYGSKNAYDPMEYTLEEGADILNLLVGLCQTQQRHSAVTARDIAKNRSPANRYSLGHRYKCMQTGGWLGNKLLTLKTKACCSDN